MAEDDSEKTESPTPRRREEARNEGNIARSTDLSAACTLLGAVLLLNWLGMRVLEGMKITVEHMLSPVSGNPTRAEDLADIAGFSGWVMVTTVAPLILAMTGVGLLAAVAQVGLVVTTKPLEPSLSKLSPLKGLKQMLDSRAGFRLVMSLSKLALVSMISIAIVAQDIPAIMRLAELELLSLFAAACGLIYSLALKLALALLLLALIDWAFQKWRREKDLRMSKQDVKEEMRRMEGDPLIKQRRARVARQLAMQRLGQAVPKADVIVTNPTHFAVALQYDARSMRAPKVIAKGADFMAMRIRQLAAANGVPMVERKSLAQALYKTVDVGQEVPSEFYNAVAEILAYVYRLSGRRSA